MRKRNWRGGVVTMMVIAFSAAWGEQSEAGERVVPVPLGGSVTARKGESNFGVYVPTRFGGNLTIKTTSGTIEAITGPDGRTRINGQEVGNDAQGWYTFRVEGSEGSYSVSNEFVQIGQAARMPWNFYYWPTKSDAIHEPWDGTGDGRANTQAMGDDEQALPVGAYAAPGQDVVRAGPNGILETMPSSGDTSTWFPNLYDDLTFRGSDGSLYATPSPMLKYDQLFNQSARMWEAANSQNHDIQRWPGHCLGGAVASITFNEPMPAPGSGLTQDELKGLYAELGENHYNHQIGDNVNNVPAGPPRPGWDPTDSFVPRFHSVLETHIRGQRKALLANLRAFPPNGKPNEVWNHGVGKYVATYHAVPGRGERSVRIDLELTANTGSDLNHSDTKPRINSYSYILVYGLNGTVDESQTAMADWISVGKQAMFAPLNVMEVVSSRWQGHNPMVTEANVKAVDLANGGGFGGTRFAGTAPQFRPVSAYEGGRAPMFALGNNRGGFFGGGGVPDDSYNNAGTPTRGRFFGIFGR
ncbi:MAG TPA: hypothetical protein VFT74_11575 [Isosphaeraceae bacterium]|nr:hypothetical protein [Isosphaeraceae bacterium]